MTSEFVAQTRFKSNHNNPARFIWSHVRRHPLLIMMLLIGAFSNAALAAAVPGFIGEAFKALSEPDGGGLDRVRILGLSIIGSQSLRAALQFMRNFAAENFGQQIERDVRDELYSSLLGKSMRFHDMTPVGEIMARATNDVRELNFMMNPGFNMLIGSGMFLIVPVMSAPLIHPQLILVPVCFVTLHLIVQYRFVTTLHPIAQKVRSSFGQMNSRLAEALDGLEVVKGAAQEQAETARFNSLVEEVRDYFVWQGRIEARYLSYLLLGLSFVFGFAHSVILYQAEEILLGDIVAYITLLNLFGFPVFTSLMSLSRIALGYASADRILSLIVAKVDLDRNVAGRREKIEGAIRFEDVCFRYIDVAGKEVLSHITFDVKAGQTVAIVGQTGAGKSTVTKLINRIYDATHGRVLVDGVDVRDWDLESLRSQISIIEQDIFLFSRTIAENIAFGRQDATREEIIAAAKKAQAHEFITSFPEGYDTVIGQRGVTLSGGQRQRLAIARAFVTNPPILILDDSTSAIDSATEDRIQKAIWSAAKDRTTLLITHRLSQIRWADHIVVLRQGTVVAQGDHDTLLASSDSYRRIFARYEQDEPSATQEEA